MIQVPAVEGSDRFTGDVSESESLDPADTTDAQLHTQEIVWLEIFGKDYRIDALRSDRWITD